MNVFGPEAAQLKMILMVYSVYYSRIQRIDRYKLVLLHCMVHFVCTDGADLGSGRHIRRSCIFEDRKQDFHSFRIKSRSGTGDTEK